MLPSKIGSAPSDHLVSPYTVFFENNKTLRQQGFRNQLPLAIAFRSKQVFSQLQVTTSISLQPLKSSKRTSEQMGWCFGISLRTGVRAIAAFYLVFTTLVFGLFLFSRIVKMFNSPEEVNIKIETAVNSIPFAFIIALSYGLYSGATALKATGCKVWLSCQLWLLLILTVNSISTLIHGSRRDRANTVGIWGSQALLCIVVYKFIRQLKDGVYLPK